MPIVSQTLERAHWTKVQSFKAFRLTLPRSPMIACGLTPALGVLSFESKLDGHR
jgi:hypothetical protein